MGRDNKYYASCKLRSQTWYLLLVPNMILVTCSYRLQRLKRVGTWGWLSGCMDAGIHTSTQAFAICSGHPLVHSPVHWAPTFSMWSRMRVAGHQGRFISPVSSSRRPVSRNSPFSSYTRLSSSTWRFCKKGRRHLYTSLWSTKGANVCGQAPQYLCSGVWVDAIFDQMLPELGF